MKYSDNTYGSMEEQYWNEGFCTFPLGPDGKEVFLSGLTGYKGEPMSEVDRGKYKRDFGHRNLGIAGFLHDSMGRRDETRFLLWLDNDDETGEALNELEGAIQVKLPKTVSVTARGEDSKRRKFGFIANGHRLRLPSKIMAGRIDIVSDVQRCVAIEGTHLKTGAQIVTYGPDGNPLGRPLNVSDFAECPPELLHYLVNLGSNGYTPNSSEGDWAVEDFLASLDNREPSYFAQESLDEIALNRNFGNDGLYAHLADLVTLANIRERGTLKVYEELHWCWHAREHVSGNPEREWEHALGNAVKHHWFGPPSTVLNFTYREMMLGWIEEARTAMEALDLEGKFRVLAKGRPNIEHCFSVAEITGDRPIALIAAHLIQVNNEIPYTVKLKSSLGEEPLNQVLVVSGGTGTGKSAVLKNSESSLYWRYPRLRSYYGPTEPVSGEGANMAFKREVRASRGATPTYTWRYPERNELFLMDEVGLLEKRASRQGSTMLETILVHHSGSHISRAKADGSVMSMQAGEYKVNWVIGTQPKRSEFFFNESAVAAGLAGRCLWVSVTLQDDSESLEEDDWDYTSSYEIEPHEVRLPNWGPAAFWKPIFIYPTEELHRELRRAKKLGQRGKVNPLESHTVRNKARLAAILAIADNRLEMNDEDVELAEILTQISRKTYQEALSELLEYKNSQNAAAGRTDGVRRHYGARRQHELDVQHHARRIRTKLLERCGAQPASIEDLRHVRKNNFKAETRDEFWSEAIEYLASQADLPEQLKEISSLEEIRARESDANLVKRNQEY